jgi:hypothetical protein
MMNKRNPYSKPVTDRPAEADELNFEDDAPTRDADETAEEEILDPTIRTAGLTEASQPGEGPTNDDLTQETLILEDGARSPHEPQQGNVEPADKTLSIVRDDEIGAGSGLDEAELARAEPLNRGKTNNGKLAQEK